MYNKTMGSYDEIPEGMKTYINNYGCHFNKRLCEEAVRNMYAVNNGKVEYITPYTKEQVESLLKKHNITLKRGKMYDATYVANMAKADFLGRSIPDEAHLAQFVKDMIDDADAIDGFIFNRWYADTMFMDIPIEWEDMI